ncbi:hypothetical protein AVEN_195689-1 [Araneus ventricosus]|uniref:STPR domain-containing protein n=1 Tax=Araneus ventricosus TaxID=182803 RepID=A0A4Y2BAC2_ARAVE|nr:hypothetical protein AVEN_195689-1 [Araneus ventricosus]
MAQRGQKRRAEETEEQRNRGLSHMAQRGLERKTEETEEQRNSRLSDMAQRSQEKRAKEIRRTKEWSIDLALAPSRIAIRPLDGDRIAHSPLYLSLALAHTEIPICKTSKGCDKAIVQQIAKLTFGKSV